MPTEILGANLGHQRRTGAASGVAGTTTAAFTPFIKGTEHINLEPRNFASSAAIIKFALCPYLVILKADSADGLGGHLEDNSDVAQDGSTSTTVNLNSFTAGRALYVGSAIPFRGVYVDVDTVDDQSAVITVSYWNGSSWVDTGDTDGTIDGGHSLGATAGTIAWTVPSAWQLSTLDKLASAAGESLDSSGQKYRDTNMYWTKWTWSATLKSTTDLFHMIGMNESTAYSELTSSTAFEGRIHNGFGSNGVGGIELLTDTGTANVLVTCSAMNGYFSTGVIS